MHSTDMDNEGLVPLRGGLANPMYGDDYSRNWWQSGFDSSNFNQVFMPVANGIPRVAPVSLVLSTLSDNYKAFTRCGPLQAIVTRTAEALMNGIWQIRSVSTKEDVSADTAENKAIVELLNNPNPMQTYADLLKTFYIYRAIYGGAYIVAKMPAGYTNVRDAISLWVFAPDEVKTEYTGCMFTAKKIGDVVSKYVITPANTEFGGAFEAKPEHVIAFFDTAENPMMTKGVAKGNRIRSLYYEIRNIMQAQEAIYSLNSDRGAQGIISNSAKDTLGFVPMADEEKEALQNRFRSNYGLRREQQKVFVTQASVDYTPIGFNVRDLMIFEGVRENIMHLCDTMNYPFDLLASEKGKTAADKRTSMTVLYQDNIIPLSIDFSAKMTSWFGLKGDENVIYISFDHLPIMQTGNVEKNNALRQLIQALHIAYNGEVISREEFRRTIGYKAEIQGTTMRSQTDAQSSRDDVRVTTS